MVKTDPEKLKRLRELTITKDRDIRMYMHCALCMDDFKAKTSSTLGESPESYARLSVGFTPIGLQICGIMYHPPREIWRAIPT